MTIYAPHATFEIEIAGHLSACGFLLGEATYHEVMPDAVRQRLVAIYDPTSLYVRGRADRVAVHGTHPVVFEWEAKTHSSRRGHDCMVELLPMLHHLSRAALGVRCLYAYRDAEIGVDGGFWIHDLPPVRAVYLTPRFDAELRALALPQIKRYMPSAQVCEINRTLGSGDPFMVIDESVARTLTDWRQLVDDELDVPFNHRTRNLPRSQWTATDEYEHQDYLGRGLP